MTAHEQRENGSAAANGAAELPPRALRGQSLEFEAWLRGAAPARARYAQDCAPVATFDRFPAALQHPDAVAAGAAVARAVDGDQAARVGTLAGAAAAAPAVRAAPGARSALAADAAFLLDARVHADPTLTQKILQKKYEVDQNFKMHFDAVRRPDGLLNYPPQRRYLKGIQLGRGGQGAVRRVTVDGEEWALKVRLCNSIGPRMRTRARDRPVPLRLTRERHAPGVSGVRRTLSRLAALWSALQLCEAARSNGKLTQIQHAAQELKLQQPGYGGAPPDVPEMYAAMALTSPFLTTAVYCEWAPVFKAPGCDLGSRGELLDWNQVCAEHGIDTDAEKLQKLSVGYNARLFMPIAKHSALPLLPTARRCIGRDRHVKCAVVRARRHHRRASKCFTLGPADGRHRRTDDSGI